MSGKQLRRLALVLAVMLVVWGAVALANRSGKSEDATTFLPTMDTALIDSVIVILKPGDTSNIVSVRPAGWRINGYPIDTMNVHELLRVFADTPLPGELVAQHASSHEKLGVTADSARAIRIVGKGGQVLADFLVGKPAAKYSGVYVRHRDSAAVYAMRGRMRNALVSAGDDFRDRRVFAVAADSIGAIEVQRGARAYTLTRGTAGTWTFANGTAADSAEAAGLVSIYRDIRAVAFEKPVQKDSLHFDTPAWRSRLLNRSGAVLASFRFDSSASGVWVRHDSGGPGYKLDGWTSRKIAPAEGALRSGASK